MSSVISGFDVSKWQPSVYAGGGGFAFGLAKATEGNGYADIMYTPHLAAIRAHGLIAGAYHFARPDLGNSPEAEADWFLAVVGDPTGLLLALDLEAGGGNLQSWRDRFCDRVEQRAGKPCWWYSYDHFVRLHSLNTAGTPYPYWAAWPDSNGQLPTYNFGPPVMQQWGLTGVPGIGGQIDANRFFGSVADLGALTIGGGGAKGRKKMDRDDWAAFYGALIVIVLRDPPLLDKNQPDGEDYYWADHTLAVGPRQAMREFLNAMKQQAAVPIPLEPVPGPQGPAGDGAVDDAHIAEIARKAVEDALANG